MLESLTTPKTMPATPPTPDAIAADLARFVAPDQYTELRALHVGGRGRTFSGWFDGKHLTDLARNALALTRQAAGVYFTPNPVHPRTAAKRLNRVFDVHRGFTLSHDSDIIERRFLLIDLDPVRLFNARFGPLCPKCDRRHEGGPEGCDVFPPVPTQEDPTTSRELVWTIRTARRYLLPALAGLGFAEPVEMLSGNGIHLIYQLSPLPGGPCPPNDPAAAILRELDARFSCTGMKIDAATYNPARMLKVPGTFARKGELTHFRPHRRVRLLRVPNGWKPPEPVGVALEPAAVEAPRPGQRAPQAQPRLEPKPAGRKPARATTPGLFADAATDGNPVH